MLKCDSWLRRVDSLANVEHVHLQANTRGSCRSGQRVALLPTVVRMASTTVAGAASEKWDATLGSTFCTYSSSARRRSVAWMEGASLAQPHRCALRFLVLHLFLPHQRTLTEYLHAAFAAINWLTYRPYSPALGIWIGQDG